MKKYEAMFVIKPDLADTDKKTLFNQFNDSIAKNGGSVTQASVWSEKRKLYFPIKKHQEGVYYLMNFSVPSDALVKLRQAYKLNENILRVLITRVDS